MPPKAKVTREMVVQAGFDVVREEGIERMNARALSARLGCSTQPVMYLFDTMEEIRREVYRRADAFHSAYITRTGFSSYAPLLEIGLLYIRFAAEEKPLFRFLFQSGEFSRRTVLDLMEEPALEPVLLQVERAAQVQRAQAKEIFMTVFLVAHGYASLLANNPIVYDQETTAAQLERAFDGALRACMEGKK